MTERISLTEASEILDVHRSTMWRWRRDGYGPTWEQIGDRYVYRLDSVLEWKRKRVSPEKQSVSK